jgi:hypothetical protein
LGGCGFDETWQLLRFSKCRVKPWAAGFYWNKGPHEAEVFLLRALRSMNFFGKQFQGGYQGHQIPSLVEGGFGWSITCRSFLIWILKPFVLN